MNSGFSQENDKNQLLQLALEQNRLSCVIVDGQYRVVYANPLYLEQMELRYEDLLGAKIDLAGENDGSNDYQEFRNAILAHEPWQGPQAQRSRNGRDFWERVVLSLVHDPETGEDFWVRTGEDVFFTRRVDHETELVKSQMESLLTSLRDVVWSAMLPGYQLVYMNKAITTVFGYGQQDFYGKPQYFQTLIHPDDLENYLKVQKELLSKETLELEYRFKHGKGHWIWVLDRSWVVKDTEGNPWRVDGILSDITQNKRFLDELIKSKKESERANEAKARFLSTITHEIRTPLNGIIGSADLLLQSTLDKQQVELAQLLKRGGGQLLNLVNDVLDVTKLESGHMELEDISFNVAQVITETVELLEPVARQKNLQIVLEISPQVPLEIYGDPHRLRQIVVNLLGNALKFTPHGHILVSLEVKLNSQDKPFYLLSVRDTGIGIAKDKQAELFEPFMQADNSITRQYGGTGLGLAICKQLVEKMGGNIRVVSQLGQGTTFEVTVPLRICDSLAPKVTQDTLKLKGLRVIAAEDNTVNQKLLEVLAKQQGFYLTVVSNGKEFLDRVVTFGSEFDLVLMDCEMPILDGFLATQHLRFWEMENPKRQPLLVFALTAHDPSFIEERAKKVGMDRVLTKPVTAASLLKAMGQGQVKGSIHSEEELILDYDDLFSRMNGEMHIVRLILEQSLGLFPGMLQDLQQAWDIRDREIFLRMVHGLKGAFAGVSAHVLRNQTEEIEDLMRNDEGWPHPVEVCMEMMKRGLELFTKSAEVFLQENPDGS